MKDKDIAPAKLEEEVDLDAPLDELEEVVGEGAQEEPAKKTPTDGGNEGTSEPAPEPKPEPETPAKEPEP